MKTKAKDSYYSFHDHLPMCGRPCHEIAVVKAHTTISTLLMQGCAGKPRSKQS